MGYVFSFLSGLLLANGIPHFVNGISGKDFHDPSLRKLVPNVPSPLFNVIWGLINFAIAIALRFLVRELVFGPNLLSASFALGFTYAAIGLSVYFRRRYHAAAT